MIPYGKHDETLDGSYNRDGPHRHDDEWKTPAAFFMVSLTGNSETTHWCWNGVACITVVGSVCAHRRSSGWNNLADFLEGWAYSVSWSRCDGGHVGDYPRETSLAAIWLTLPEQQASASTVIITISTTFTTYLRLQQYHHALSSARTENSTLQ